VERSGCGAKAPPLAARPKLAGWGGIFLMVHRNNAGRLGAGFISVKHAGWVKNVVSMCRDICGRWESWGTPETTKDLDESKKVRYSQM